MGASLSHRERALLAFERKESERTPFAMICSGINSPARELFEEELARRRGMSLRELLEPLLDVEGVEPPLKAKLGKGFDVWGVHRSPQGNEAGGVYEEIDFHPLADCESPDDLKRHAWPVPGLFDYEALRELVAAKRKDGNRCLIAHGGNIFETAWYLRGFERMLTDLALNPEFACALLDKVCDFYVEKAARVFGAAKGEIDLAFTADDIGCQKGLLLSLEMWEEFIKPRHARLNARLHELGAKVVYHSDGGVMEAVPGLIECGIDALQALQFDAAGMDPVKLKELYGAKLCFVGGVSVQRTLPFGTPEEVEAEVLSHGRTLGAGGGYVLGPSHAIQAGTPPENILAFFDAAARCRAS